VTTTLILVRHGQTDSNLNHRYQGQSDVPMNDTGRAEIRAVARHLAGVRAAAIYCSDLGRSREAAAMIGDALRLEPVAVADLRERNFGKVEGLTREEAEARFPDSWELWRRNRTAWIPPGGESLGEMWGRVLAAVEGLWRRHEGETFVYAGHGGPINAVVCHSLGASVEAREAIAIGNASITIIARNDSGPAVVMLNETCHLKEPLGDVDAD
jgi:broad specificity phosphatase PhoE